MKASLLALLLLFSVQKILAQTNNDLASEDLKGRVKMVTELYFYEGQKSCGMKTIDKYDYKGWLTEETHNDFELKLTTNKCFTYDTGNNGNITRLNEFDDSGILVHTIDYKYDSQNHLSGEEDHRNINDKNIVSQKEYYYDASSNKAREKNYTNGTLNYTTDYAYDNKGRLSGTKSHDKNDTLIMLYDYYYTGYEQWVHCEKQIHGVRTHLFRVLDTLGIPIKQTSYTNDFSKETIENYSDFDKQGNWLKLIVTGDTDEQYYITRAIEYYDR
jgi:hypothetical protein